MRSFSGPECLKCRKLPTSKNSTFRLPLRKTINSNLPPSRTFGRPGTNDSAPRRRAALPVPPRISRINGVQARHVPACVRVQRAKAEATAAPAGSPSARKRPGGDSGDDSGEAAATRASAILRRILNALERYLFRKWYVKIKKLSNWSRLLIKSSAW